MQRTGDPACVWTLAGWYQRGCQMRNGGRVFGIVAIRGTIHDRFSLALSVAE